MAVNITIWHNPRCSKSRQTLALLQERGIEPEIRLYLKDPPDAEEIRAVQKMLGLPVIGFTRTGEKIFRELGLSKDSPEDEIVRAMAEHPVLIERPIVIAGARAALGRPPEAVLEIL